MVYPSQIRLMIAVCSLTITGITAQRIGACFFSKQYNTTDYGGAVNTAPSVSTCKTACSQDSICLGIDWVTNNTAGQQCFLLLITTRGANYSAPEVIHFNYFCKGRNECNTTNGGCSQFCFDNPYDYTCSCREGYQLSKDGINCDNVDECENDPCPPFQHCIDNIGSYDCNSYYPTPRPYDKDCEKDNGGCEHECSYKGPLSPLCSCKQGYQMNSNGKTCDDVDECLANPCGSFGCVNKVGSYDCVNPTMQTARGT